MSTIEFQGDPEKRFIPGYGPLSPKIVIVGEAPGYEELDAGKPFVGASGRFLNGLLSEVGIDRNSCWVTNVCKYFVPPSPKKRPVPFKVRAKAVGIDLNEQIDNLRREIQSLQPNLIICLGATALNAVTGKSNIIDYRGSILEGFGYKTIATYHPAHILHSSGESTGFWNKSVMLFDLKRCKVQSEFKEIKLPIRILDVVENSADLIRFLKTYDDPNLFPAIDIEAWKCIPVCIGLSYTPSHGITLPLWNCNSISSIPSRDLVQCWSLLSERFIKTDAIGQNFGYDRDKIKRLGFKVRSIKSDTMLKSFVISPELPKNLAFNTSVYTEEPFYKNEGMYEGELRDLFIGCARDACCTKEVDIGQDKDLDDMGCRDYYEKFMIPLQPLYAEIEQLGFAVDEERRKVLIRKYIEQDEKLRFELYQLTGKYINVNSPKQVPDLLYNQWGLKNQGGAGEEILTNIINSTKFENIKRGCELILEDRRVRKTIGSYAYALPDFDGRMRTSYFLCLKTGRSSTQTQDPPIRPDEEYVEISDGKKTKKHQSRGMAFQTITKHGDIGPDIRSILTVDEGYVFLQADLSQAEARVIFLLAEDYEALELIDKVDYHALTTTWFLGGSIDQYSKKVLGYECPERFLGKTLRHAGHLGARGKRAAAEVNTQARKFKIPITINERKADDALKIFHARQPRIKGVFQKSVIECLEKNRVLIAPVPYGIDAKIGGSRTFFERMNDDLYREAYGYIPQRTVSEHTKAAALRIKGSPEHSITGRAPWIRIHVEAHDALLVSVPIERKLEAANILKEEFMRPIDFSTCSIQRDKLIIPCDLEEGYNYHELDKFSGFIK